LLTLYAFIGSFLLAMTYRTSQIYALPDVGEPFDVEAYCGRLPPSDDAAIYYRRSISKLKVPEVVLTGVLLPDWEEITEDERAWVLANSEAITLWREGTTRRGMSYLGLEMPFQRDLEGIVSSVTKGRVFAQFALLEASRSEHAGEMTSALDWCLALLRFSRHLEMHAELISRSLAIPLHRMAQDALDRWAADPRVNASLLRSALDQVLTIEAMTPPPSESLKADYLAALNQLTTSGAALQLGRSGRGDPESEWYLRLPAVLHARWFLNGDPERTRRVLRMLFANWLAQCDKPWDARPMFVSELRLYDDPGASPAARALPAQDLGRIASETPTLLGLYSHPSLTERILASERMKQAELVINLAERLHHRLYGFVPTFPEALVGRVLMHLPDEYDPAIHPRPGPRPVLLSEPPPGPPSQLLLNPDPLSVTFPIRHWDP